MTSLRCYGNSDLDGLSPVRVQISISCVYYVLVRCDLYLKLEGVTVGKSDRAT